ncbi:unnamed protein product [Bursaphelenchus xylophilus]|uniref:(pine wood nematode) hypothetical protein n=1 Tax=Bursaphelenchus xylophilus TaxID=6326 RepID=A0A1I7S2J1_BURXY|nr:unnamed protein product [Bursaphelenchus xylophilus]CAG9121915.1 unnamed protein product [Bursaphelenchus xylophilus]
MIYNQKESLRKSYFLSFLKLRLIMKTVFTVLLLVALSAAALAELMCEENGKKFRNGQEWTANKNFLKTCVVHDMGWETKIIACLNPSTKQRIPVGSSVVNGKYRIRCERSEDGGVSIRSGPA